MSTETTETTATTPTMLEVFEAGGALRVAVRESHWARMESATAYVMIATYEDCLDLATEEERETLQVQMNYWQGELRKVQELSGSIHTRMDQARERYEALVKNIKARA